MRINYDKESDTLYIVIADNSNSYGDNDNGIIIMRDIDTDEITGLTILSAHKLFEEN